MSETPAGSAEIVGGFQFVDVPTSQVDQWEADSVPVADAARRLNEALIRSRAEGEELRSIAKELEGLVERLEATAHAGPAGVRYNAEGRSWEWGNAAVGLRNVVAPPMTTEFTSTESVRGEAVLGAAYEGPPGMVHGGVSALLLDQVMGKTASRHHTQFTFTGTLTMKYLQPLPLGPVEVLGRIDRQEGRKVFVVASIGTPGSVAVSAEGIFIKPAWAEADAAAAAVNAD
ncbi:MAG: PaaI family thioesterase [Nocardioides sp.]|uniref:PaaI family thioesterase n=1 Tax=Nocardioides sp. TaxID=35761 RepID=UPI003F129E6D